MATQAFATDVLESLKKDNLTDDIIALARQTNEYRKRNPNDKLGGVFNKEVILNILNQPTCVAFRYYFGIDIQLEPDDQSNQFRNPTLIVCGVDQNGDDILPGTGADILSGAGSFNNVVEKSWACPPNCSAPNKLTAD